MEILLIVVIVLGVFILPKLLRKQTENEHQRSFRGVRLSGWKRLAIVASALWLALSACYLKPKNDLWLFYLLMAAGPVVLAWGIFWVFSGFKKRKK